ncbi:MULTISPECIES: alpha/beta fold hydrolase [Falsihalocynthiibacter]|uniref:alpha/beta hydrolase family protein n=1 Tax=Falsihalocynthiibacter TaxID=2854182 RepID=UPI003003491A
MQDKSITRSETVSLSADGANLVGTSRVPSDQLRAFVLIHGAVGVPQTFYAKFANWLAEAEGIASLTYDYRDFGASSQKPMRDSDATMADWGTLDQAAALTFAIRQADQRGVPLWVIGHSFGGFMTGFHEDASKIDRFIAVASGPVNWREHPLSYMPLAMLFWFVIGPLATVFSGYLPGRRIGLGADLPAGVYWQWRRWCLTRTFFRNDSAIPWLSLLNPSRLQCPLKTVAFTDDQLIPPRTVNRLKELYPKADVIDQVFAPSDFSLKKIGHFGAFSARNTDIWRAIID